MADLTEIQAAQTVKISGASASGTESNFAQVTSANGEVKSVDGLKEGGVYGALTLTTGGTTYEAKVGGARLTNRKSLIVTALDDMFWGFNNSVTTSTGTPLYKNQQIIFAIDPDSTFQVWLVATTNTKTARIAESL